MREQQIKPADATRSRPDGDGRDKEYWEAREFLLSLKVAATFMKNAGQDGGKMLEILVHGYLIGNKEEAYLDKKSRELLEEAVPLIEAEMGLTEVPGPALATKAVSGETARKWMH